MLILDENFRMHLEAFASELFIYIYIYIYICIYFIYTLPSKSLETPLAKCGFGRYQNKSLSFFGANTLK